MISIPGQRKPIITKTTWYEKAMPALVSLMLLLIVLVVRAAEAVK